MTQDDLVFTALVDDMELATLLAKTEWNEVAVYNDFIPPEQATDVKVPYITYQVDIQDIDPWPMKLHTYELDIWDMNDGNDNTLAMQIGTRVKRLLDRQKLLTRDNQPIFLRCTNDYWVQDMIGVVHRKLIFTAKRVDMSLLTV